MIKKEVIKNTISVISLVAILLVSYYINKKQKEFNPFLLKLNTGKESLTLQQLKDNKQIVLMYFGFLSCPEVCPTTLASMANVFKELPKEKLDKITFLFIDLDPERDKIEEIKNYTEFFDKKIIPVSLTLEELVQFTRFFGITFTKVPIKSEMKYTIDHSTDIVVLSPEGKNLEPIHHDSSKVLIMAKINQIYDEFF